MKKLVKKEKGKMKSGKVPVLRSLDVGGWMSLLLAFSLLLFTSAARAALAAGNVVTTTLDDASTQEGDVSLRAAAEYAMTNDVPVVFSDGLFSGGKVVFVLNRQIDIPKGAALRIDAGTGRTVELHPAEAKTTNRFFNVFGSLSAVGLTMLGGCAGSDYGETSLWPTNDADGGAVIGYGPMAFTNCNFLSNRASGHGGAVWSCGGLSLSGCSFVSNRAEQCGGAVYSKQEDLFVTGTTLVGNSAGEGGGGIFVFNSTNRITVTDSDFVANHAMKVAGGLYLEGGAEDRIVEIRGIDTRIIGNTAGVSSDNLFVGEWVKFDESNVERVSDDYVRIVTDGGLPRIVLDEEKAKPELGDFHIGAGEDGEVTVVVNNVVIGLWYGIGRAESPVGPYVVDKWFRATSASPLELTAQKTGAAGFYKIMARE